MRTLLLNLLAALLLSISFAAKAQHNRLNTYGKVAWYNYFGTFKLSEKFSIHTEYQWRRDNFLPTWQQSLLRGGINFKPTTGILFRAGYGWIETFPYGEIPLNPHGRDFTEHRIFEMMQLTHQESRFSFQHRFMLEQRFVGRYSNPLLASEDEFTFLNRMRYMFRIQVPLKGKELSNHTPYLVAYDEIFIGFGKNVNMNIFDQNRIGALLGYRLSPLFAIEAGYINQLVQFGRTINGKNIFQHNHGLIINANFTFDLSRKKPAG